MGIQCTPHKPQTILGVIGECIRRREIAARVAGEAKQFGSSGTLPWRGSRKGRSGSSRAAWNVEFAHRSREVLARFGRIQEVRSCGDHGLTTSRRHDHREAPGGLHGSAERGEL